MARVRGWEIGRLLDRSVPSGGHALILKAWPLVALRLGCVIICQSCCARRWPPDIQKVQDLFMPEGTVMRDIHVAFGSCVWHRVAAPQFWCCLQKGKEASLASWSHAFCLSLGPCSVADWVVCIHVSWVLCGGWNLPQWQQLSQTV